MGAQPSLFTEGALYHVLVVIQNKMPKWLPWHQAHAHHLSLAWAWLLSKVSCLRNTTRLTRRAH